MRETRLKTDWNMAQAELMVIDAARRDALVIYLRLRFNALLELTFLDLLNFIYLTISPKLMLKKNENIFKTEIDGIAEGFKACSELAVKEQRRAKRAYSFDGSSRPASAEFMTESFKLFSLLMRVKDGLGLGLTHSENIGVHDSINRAFD